MPDIFVDEQINRKAIDQAEAEEKKETPPAAIKSTTARNTGHNVNMLSTFVRHPLGITLAEQHEDEHILLFIRRDFITNLPWIFAALLLTIIPFFIPPFFQFIGISLSFIPENIVFLLVVFYYIIILGFIFANFVTWFYDIGIVTEERAVDIDFYNISYVSVATARAQDLKDVRYAQKGFFQSLFDYGDVAMVVEASGEMLTFEYTPRPAEVVSILSALIGGHQE